jgi:hypothetical protein
MDQLPSTVDQDCKNNGHVKDFVCAPTNIEGRGSWGVLTVNYTPD